MNDNNREINTKTLAETDNYMIWQAEEPDGETTYHMELNNVTLHFFQEEWEELIALVNSLKIKTTEYLLAFWAVGGNTLQPASSFTAG